MKPLIYLDNIIFSLQKVGGISVYWLELLQRLNRSFHHVVMFEPKSGSNSLCRNALKDVIKICSEWGALPVIIRRYLPIMARLEAPSIFHSSYYRISMQKGVVNIVTVHDFTYERYRSGLAKIVHSLQKKFAFKHADGIICVSQSTKKDLLNYYPRLQCQNVRVIYLGVSSDFYPLDENPPVDEMMTEITSKKYIVFIGARRGYKNFDIAVDVVAQITNCSMLIVGGGDLSAQEKKILQEKIPGQFWHCLGVSDSDLNIMYNNAFCLLYPSGYEGFGLPVVEAMAAGCPVVAVNVSSIPEASGEAGLLVDEPKVANFIQQILLLENFTFRDEVIQRGLTHAGQFSWDLCYQQTEEFYKQVFEQKLNIPFD